MPIESDLTTMFGIELQLQLDAIGEQIKDLIGWPPLGVQTLTESGIRAREHAQAEELAKYLIPLGQQGAIELLQANGEQLMESMGQDALQEAVRLANVAFLAEHGATGREDMLLPEGQ